jgi:Flp pilus assembly protein TadG
MLFQRFLDDRSASVVPLLAVAAIPVVGLIGASVDYSRAAAVQTAMQAAVDSTSLALAKSAASSNAQQLQASAQAIFNAMFTRTDAAAPTVAVNYTTTGGSHVVVSATSSVNTLFMGIMGFRQIPVAASSTSTWGNNRLRVALVLDNTGSMTQGGAGTAQSPNKIQALKTATHNLLGQLQAAATTNGDVYVSIVPFTRDVNVGAGSFDQSLIDWTDWDANNGSNVKTGQTCTNTNWGQSCTNNYTWTPAAHSTWNGCVADRDQNYDTLNTAPTAGALFPADQYSVCPQALVAQTYDWTALSSKVDAMVAAGNTNQAIGLVWGWQSLTAGSPLNAPAKDANYQYQDIIIILSDGMNTQDRWYSNASSIDARQRLLCDNIKTAGVTIYAIQVNTGNDPTSTVLQYCAGTRSGVADAGKFFLLTSPNEIITTFNQIGTGLSKLRISY